MTGRFSGRIRRLAPLLAAGGLLFASGSSCSVPSLGNVFGSLVSFGGQGIDSDGDGFTDAQELLSGTDTTDSSDHP